MSLCCYLLHVCCTSWFPESHWWNRWTQRNRRFPWKQMKLMTLQGQRSSSGNIRDAQVRPREKRWHKWLTNFTRLRVDFVSDDPVKTEGLHSTLVLMICVVKNSLLLPVDGADAGHAVMVAHSLQQQLVSDLPGEHAGVGVFQTHDHLHNAGSGHFGLRASNQSWSNAACLIVPKLTIMSCQHGETFCLRKKFHKYSCWCDLCIYTFLFEIKWDKAQEISMLNLQMDSLEMHLYEKSLKNIYILNLIKMWG